MDDHRAHRELFSRALVICLTRSGAQQSGLDGYVEAARFGPTPPRKDRTTNSSPLCCRVDQDTGRVIFECWRRYVSS